MADYERVEANIILSGNGVETRIKIEGVHVPKDPHEIGNYFGKRVGETLAGMTDGEARGMAEQIAKLEKSLEKKDDEIAGLKALVDETKKAAVAKRNVPRG